MAEKKDILIAKREIEVSPSVDSVSPELDKLDGSVDKLERKTSKYLDKSNKDLKKDLSKIKKSTKGIEKGLSLKSDESSVTSDVSRDYEEGSKNVKGWLASSYEKINAGVKSTYQGLFSKEKMKEVFDTSFEMADYALQEVSGISLPADFNDFYQRMVSFTRDSERKAKDLNKSLVGSLIKSGQGSFSNEGFKTDEGVRTIDDIRSKIVGSSLLSQYSLEEKSEVVEGFAEQGIDITSNVEEINKTISTAYLTGRSPSQVAEHAAKLTRDSFMDLESINELEKEMIVLTKESGMGTDKFRTAVEEVTPQMGFYKKNMKDFIRDLTLYGKSYYMSSNEAKDMATKLYQGVQDSSSESNIMMASNMKSLGYLSDAFKSEFEERNKDIYEKVEAESGPNSREIKEIFESYNRSLKEAKPEEYLSLYKDMERKILSTGVTEKNKALLKALTDTRPIVESISSNYSDSFINGAAYAKMSAKSKIEALFKVALSRSGLKFSSLKEFAASRDSNDLNYRQNIYMMTQVMKNMPQGIAFTEDQLEQLVLTYSQGADLSKDIENKVASLDVDTEGEKIRSMTTTYSESIERALGVLSERVYRAVLSLYEIGKALAERLGINRELLEGIDKRLNESLDMVQSKSKDIKDKISKGESVKSVAMGLVSDSMKSGFGLWDFGEKNVEKKKSGGVVSGSSILHEGEYVQYGNDSFREKSKSKDPLFKPFLSKTKEMLDYMAREDTLTLRQKRELDKLFYFKTQSGGLTIKSGILELGGSDPKLKSDMSGGIAGGSGGRMGSDAIWKLDDYLREMGGAESGGDWGGGFNASRSTGIHGGYDLPGTANETTPFAMMSGKVLYSNIDYSREGSAPWSLGYGMRVETQVGKDKIWIDYGHMNKLPFKQGDEVKAGQKLATLYDMNWAHLDMKVRLNGELVDYNKPEVRDKINKMLGSSGVTSSPSVKFPSPKVDNNQPLAKISSKTYASSMPKIAVENKVTIIKQGYTEKEIYELIKSKKYKASMK